MSESPRKVVVDDDLELVPIFTVDRTVLLTLVRSNLDHLGEWLGFATGNYSEGDVDVFFESSLDDWRAGSGRNYGVIRSGRLAGTIGIHRLTAPAGDLELGYWLDARAQGQGIMTRSCGALLREAFDGLGANLVVIRAAPGNARSRAVAVRLGMTEEATLRQRSNNARGELLDLVIYSITAEEWRASRRASR